MPPRHGRAPVAPVRRVPPLPASPAGGGLLPPGDVRSAHRGPHAVRRIPGDRPVPRAGSSPCRDRNVGLAHRIRVERRGAGHGPRRPGPAGPASGPPDPPDGPVPGIIRLLPGRSPGFGQDSSDPKPREPAGDSPGGECPGTPGPVPVFHRRLQDGLSSVGAPRTIRPLFGCAGADRILAAGPRRNLGRGGVSPGGDDRGNASSGAPPRPAAAQDRPLPPAGDLGAPCRDLLRGQRPVSADRALAVPEAARLPGPEPGLPGRLASRVLGVHPDGGGPGFRGSGGRDDHGGGADVAVSRAPFGRGGLGRSLSRDDRHRPLAGLLPVLSPFLRGLLLPDRLFGTGSPRNGSRADRPTHPPRNGRGTERVDRRLRRHPPDFRRTLRGVPGGRDPLEPAVRGPARSGRRDRGVPVDGGIPVRGGGDRPSRRDDRGRPDLAAGPAGPALGRRRRIPSSPPCRGCGTGPCRGRGRMGDGRPAPARKARLALSAGRGGRVPGLDPPSLRGPARSVADGDGAQRRARGFPRDLLPRRPCHAHRLRESSPGGCGGADPPSVPPQPGSPDRRRPRPDPPARGSLRRVGSGVADDGGGRDLDSAGEFPGEIRGGGRPVRGTGPDLPVRRVVPRSGRGGPGPGLRCRGKRREGQRAEPGPRSPVRRVVPLVPGGCGGGTLGLGSGRTGGSRSPGALPASPWLAGGEAGCLDRGSFPRRRRLPK